MSNQASTTHLEQIRAALEVCKIDSDSLDVSIEASLLKDLVRVIEIQAEALQEFAYHSKRGDEALEQAAAILSGGRK